MGLMDRLFGKAAAKPAAQRAVPASFHNSLGPSTRGAAGSPQAVRKETVRVSVRDTLLHNGIPSAWISAEPLTTSAPGREAGVHVRLVVKHWDDRLMRHSVALQEHVQKRILALDPEAEQWLMGLSWQFDLDDVSQCPPLPHPGSWTAVPMDDTPVRTSRANRPAPAPAPAQASGDVISGPTRIQQPGGDKRKALERMLSERDADFQREEADGSGFTRTQPMGFEKTQPMPAFDKSATARAPSDAPAVQRPRSGG